MSSFLFGPVSPCNPALKILVFTFLLLICNYLLSGLLIFVAAFSAKLSSRRTLANCRQSISTFKIN